MATIDKTFSLTIGETIYTMTHEVGMIFCQQLTCINKAISNELDSVSFRIEYNTTTWIEVTKTGNVFTVNASGGETETLQQTAINKLLSCCRSAPTHNCNCN